MKQLEFKQNDNVLDRLEFEDSYELSEYVIKLLRICENKTDYPVISIYGKYNVIKNILENILHNRIPIVSEITLEDDYVNGYNKEFVLHLTDEGVSVEKVCSDKYLYTGCDVALVHGECSARLVDYIECENIFEFNYGYEDWIHLWNY